MKINILFFIDKLSFKGFIGGAEKVLINLVNHMDTQKYNIVVQTVFPDTFSEKLRKEITYKCCFEKKNRWTELVYRAELSSGLLYQRRIRGNYDIEVAYLEFESTKAMAASTNQTARKIAWVHCDYHTAIRDKGSFVSKTKKQYERFDQIVCVSTECRRSFIDLFGMSEKTAVLHNVIDVKEILQKAELHVPLEKLDGIPVVCSVGRFSEPKNHMRLLKAAKILHDEGLQFQIWLVGDGILRPQIETFIQENRMQEYISVYGFQKNPYPFMKHADLLVCHSNFEGYSTIAQEAVVLQKEILTTECSGMHDILDAYALGTIVENKDDSFTDGLRAWLLADRVFDNKPNRSLSESTRLHEKIIAAHESLFQSLLEK